jgi:hypothetical protein
MGMDKVYSKTIVMTGYWEVKSFNVEMISPTYMKMQASNPMRGQSSNGVQLGFSFNWKVMMI